MKTILMSLASCVLLAGSALAATETTSDPVKTDHYTLLGKIKDVEDALKAARPTKSLLEDIRSTIPAFSDADKYHRERLERAINDLIERAKAASLHMNDLWRLKAMTIDAKCSAELRRLWSEAKARNATREQFDRVADLLRERAEAAKEHPDLRKLVQEEIERLKKSYLGGMEIAEMEFALLDDAAIRSLLDRAIDWLVEMAVKRNASREQFQYVKDLFLERARNFSEAVEWRRLTERVDAELERLMSGDLATRNFTREDFLKLREMLMKKASEVMGGATG